MIRTRWCVWPANVVSSTAVVTSRTKNIKKYEFRKKKFWPIWHFHKQTLKLNGFDQYLSMKLNTGGLKLVRNENFTVKNGLFICKFKIRGPKWRYLSTANNLVVLSRTVICGIKQEVHYNYSFTIISSKKQYNACIYRTWQLCFQFLY